MSHTLAQMKFSYFPPKNFNSLHVFQKAMPVRAAVCLSTLSCTKHGDTDSPGASLLPECYWPPLLIQQFKDRNLLPI